MKESLSDSLIHLGINFGFVGFFFGIVYAFVSCIINHYNNANHPHDDDDDHNNNDDHVIITIMEHGGIKPSVLRSIPVVDFNSQDFENGVVECVVCLSDIVDGDKARVLPTCDHLFHVACIDTWLRSHSTCPICRKRVALVQRETRPDDDKSLTTTPTDPPPSTNVTVVENTNCGEAGEVG